MKKKKYKYSLKRIIGTRLTILKILILLCMTILVCNLFYVQIINNKLYKEKLNTLTSNIIYGDDAPRGRIYDTLGRIIVDNKVVNVIEYRKNGMTTKEEIKLAYKLADILDVDYSNLTKGILKEFWIINNKDKANDLITEEEYKLYDERKLNSEDIKALKLERVKDEYISTFNERDKESSYIYYLMNKGYYSDTKVIKRGASDLEYVSVAESNLEGVKTSISWDRYYPYGKTFRTILGNVSQNGIPSELKDHYLELGLELNDRVGTSYLEYQYDSELRGTKNKYQVEQDGSLTLVEEGKRGNDIVLTIDIELQKEIENILENQIRYSIANENMIYYNRSYAIITEPSTGSILAMAGVQVINDNTYDYSAGIVTSPVTVGSAIKAASHIVGYNTGALHIGEVRSDNCIKIASTPIKCSWTKLGTLNDIGALKYSSNVYQFHTAINVGKGSYRYNMPLTIDESAFDIYRNTFAMFGLGVSTGIDLPVESLGYKGTSKLPGHLLDFAIGQYDTYTPLMLSQYIDTIANNGVRVAKHLLKEVYYGTNEPLTQLKYSYEVKELNRVETEDIYMQRVKEGLREVMSTSGTGYGYVNYIYNPAGKTGTSESFIDTDGDGIIDTETLSNTYVAYVPYDNPKVTFTIVSPDIGYYRSGRTIRSYVNRRISYEVSKKYFEIYQ
ncbi:MAG: penicillin-binding protein 2 [Bacilli bacterium]|nr:penicillin-binding protein 2 [Bacilli bacterium]